MADRTPDRTQTDIAQEHGPTGNTQHDDATVSSTAATVAVVAGGAGVIAGIVPRLGVLALILAVVALATGVPGMRQGRHSSHFSRARAGVALAVIALVLGAINVAIQLDAFDYFTTAAL